MVKIYIDTNIFIGIYEYAKDPIEVLDDIIKYSQHLVTTAQTINEFHRNRVLVINKLIKKFNDSVNFNPWCTSLIKHLPEFSELTDVCKEVRTKASLVVQQLQTAKSLIKDPVAQKVSIIFTTPYVISITDDLIKKAHQRKLLGNPPTSDDKYTIGDELIWECLLSKVKEDLIIVTRDQTYSDNLQILEAEFRERTGNNLIFVTDKLSKALEKIGEIPPKKLVEEEDRIIPENECPKCGSLGEFCGFDMCNGNGEVWFECNECGYTKMVY